jgi:hypothetical protein
VLRANVWLRSRRQELSEKLVDYWVAMELGRYVDIAHNGRRWRFSHETTMVERDGAVGRWLVFEDAGPASAGPGTQALRT